MNAMYKNIRKSFGLFLVNKEWNIWSWFAARQVSFVEDYHPAMNRQKKPPLSLMIGDVPWFFPSCSADCPMIDPLQNRGFPTRPTVKCCRETSDAQVMRPVPSPDPWQGWNFKWKDVDCVYTFDIDISPYMLFLCYIYMILFMIWSHADW